METMQGAALRKVGFENEEANAAIKDVAGELKGEDNVNVSRALEIFLDKVAIEVTAEHGPSQTRNYENQKRRSANRFIEVIGDIPPLDLTREQAVGFKDWWSQRIRAGDPVTGKKYTSGAGIKEASDMRLIWEKVAE
ncbi:hypothetical protein [Roseibium sp.]|uniref:hypothetical protein n=1 Tax=Roseibium sp. TaxID=1936156 RepID=UPI003BA90C49